MLRCFPYRSLGFLFCAWLFFGASAQSREPSAGSCTQDGYSAIHQSPGQHPAILVSYVRRPQCRVAGVDYPVGIPTGLSLQDPTKVDWKAPFFLDLTRHMLRCDGGSNNAIRGFDFSMHGGIGIYDSSCSNLFIENNKFGVGPNCTIPINESAEAIGIVVRRNLVDGGGFVPACRDDPVGENILLGGSGSKIVEYNWVRSTAQHFLSLDGSGNFARIRYNLFERCGFFQGNHCDGIQFVGGSWEAPVISYNTFLSDQPDPSGGLHGNQVMSFVAGSNIGLTGSADGLVTLDHTYTSSLINGMSIVSPSLPPGTTIVNVSDSGGPCCTGVGTHPVKSVLLLSKKAIKTGRFSFDVPNAYPRGMINPIQIDAQLHAKITNAQVDHNVVVASPGSIVTVSYAISVGSDDTSLNFDARIADNFLDLRGAYGAFYPENCFNLPRCHGGKFKGNVDMTTGNEIQPLHR